MIGGFLGSISRYALGEWIQTDSGFPLGTLLINVTGCFILGWLLTFVSRFGKIGAKVSLMAGTGMIGAFTTFSTFSVETITLFQDGHLVLAFLYIFMSVGLGFVLAYLGHKIALIFKEEGDAI
jgi:CrcB protein